MTNDFLAIYYIMHAQTVQEYWRFYCKMTQTEPFPIPFMMKWLYSKCWALFVLFIQPEMSQICSRLWTLLTWCEFVIKLHQSQLTTIAAKSLVIVKSEQAIVMNYCIVLITARQLVHSWLCRYWNVFFVILCWCKAMIIMYTSKLTNLHGSLDWMLGAINK